MPRMLLGIPERRRNMRPNAQLFRKKRAHDHRILARALCKQRSCSNASSNTAPLPPTSAGLTQRIGRQQAATFSEACRAAENRCPATLSARLPRHGKHCCPCRRPSPGSPPAWLRAPGLWWCKHREGRCGPEDEDDGQQATPQTSKERRQVRCRRGEPAGSRPPACTATARFADTLKVRGELDQFSCSAGGCCFQRYFQKHRTIEEHHAAAGGSGFTIRSDRGRRQFGDGQDA